MKDKIVLTSRSILESSVDALEYGWYPAINGIKLGSAVSTQAGQELSDEMLLPTNEQ
jgi:hypothetical protein